MQRVSQSSRHANATLEELEQDVWAEPAFKSRLVMECHRLRRLQLRLLTPEDLRLLIGQQIGLPYLIPMALELMRANPLVEGDYYPGDLLCAVLRADPKYWSSNTEQCVEVRAIALEAQKLAEQQGKVVTKAIAEAFAVFPAN